MEKYIGYIRTSTGRQVLGLEEQKSRINQFIETTDGELVEIISEQETGKNNNREKLNMALNLCDKNGSQDKFYDTENSTYRFVDASIQRMMTEYNVISDNIALSSDRVTLVNYISSLIDVYIKIYNIDIEKVEDFDPVDFDPDRDIENTVVYRM